MSYSLRLHATSLSWLTLGLTLMLSSCGNPYKQKQAATAEKDDVEGQSSASANSVLKWQSMVQIRSGHMNSSNNTVSSLASDASTYCYDNSVSSCQRASDTLRNDIGNNPTPIQGFEFLSGKKSTDSFSIDAAYFVTAEPQVKTDVGTYVFSERQIRVWSGTRWDQSFAVAPNCDPSDGVAVGVVAGASGNEKLLSGIQAWSDATVSGAFDSKGNLVGYNRPNAYLHAAKVDYAGMKPRSGTTESPFQFEFFPKLSSGANLDLNNFSDSSTFGLNEGDASSEAGVASTFYKLPRFGLGPDDQAKLQNTKWYSHVIIGFCFKGTRVESIATGKTVSRPILFGATSRLYRPLMEYKK